MGKHRYKKISNDADIERHSFLSLLLFRWMNIVFKTGNERPLEERDFLPLAKENTSCFVTEKLQTKWNEEKSKCQGNGKRPKLWKSVIKMLSVNDAFILIIAGGLNTLCRILEPVLLGYFMAFLLSSESQHSYLLYGCALAIFINALTRSLSGNQFAYRCELLGIRITSALKGLVYLKMLLFEKDVSLEFSIGRVIDLVTNDVQRLEEEVIMWFFFGALAFIDIVVAAPLLVYFIGWQALMGVIFLCLLAPYFAGLSYAGAALRLRTATVSDRRISLMNQVVSGIRAIKTHAWENEYREKIKNTRRREMHIIRKKGAVLSGVAALEYTSAPIASLVSVITLVLTGQPLTPVNVFMLLSFIRILRQSTCLHLAYGLMETYEAYASLGRIEEFLLLENLPSIGLDQTADGRRSNTTGSLLNSKRNGSTDHHEKHQDVSVHDKVEDLKKPTTLRVTRLTKKQIKREDEFILHNIAFNAESGTLTVITGPVGSGKSTLLSAIAGVIPDTGGAINCKGTLVYAPQIAWIFSGTIRENILFREPYDESKYTRTIEACALTHDIQQFPDGDETFVGERGVILSGGQRARVSLARAVYADADIFLFDDPLSAVDVKVGQHIFEKCIKGLLGHKTRVLTSHQEKHMKEADNVIVLYKGRVLGKGSFTVLKKEGILSTTVDPLYETSNKNQSDNTYDGEDEEKNDSDSYYGIVPQTSETKGLQISEEDRTIGVVSSKLYWNYFRSGVPSLVIFLVSCFCLITQAMIVSPDVWLSFLTKMHPEDQRDKINLYIYGCLVGAALVLAIIRAYGFLVVSLRCSERFHDKMVVAVLQAPVRFFDSNPVGRIMNRFSKDVGCMDEVLPKTFLMSLQMILLLLTGIVIPTVTNPWLLCFVLPLTALVVCVARYYLNTSRELKRLESICRSPVFSHISETLDGLDTIRTRGRQRDFVDQLYRYQDIHNQSFVMMMASGRWLGVRLDLLTATLTGVVAFAAILVSQDAAFAGLSLIYVLQTVILTRIAVKKMSSVENFMTSVERVMSYTKLKSEPGYKVERLPPEHWPREGNVTFQDISLTYYQGGPQVLKKINLDIHGGAKIGVAGRTGAGKSSFVAALMRMPDADGDIMVDGVRIKDINLREARRCISVLGQNPVLFSGSVRQNLDLMEQFQDADLWRALEDVQLKDLVQRLKGQLDHELLEHGANVSVGERQLICLARVLLQKNKIIVLDEPTAHVDPDTEKTIWNVVREKLRDSTVITIAHRLNTIRDCDMIVVLKRGEVVEFGKFNSLVNRTGSILGKMARVSDI